MPSPDIPPLDPVSAYDRIASRFPRISGQRRAYLESIDQIIVRAIATGATSLLDVGAGNGNRSLRIMRQTGISNAVWLEPSAAMRMNWPPDVEAWPIRAEDLADKPAQFDVILCLWNVLGHIAPRAARLDVLRHFGRLLSQQGRIFLDVNNRYNAREFGWPATTRRMIWDLLFPSERNGDVIAEWDIDGLPCRTSGHVFTAREMRSLCARAGLGIEQRVVVDYQTGQMCRSSYAGNYLYVLRRR